MEQRQSDVNGASSGTAVLVPLRSLRDGKLRLDPALSAERRAGLIESMAATVVRAALHLPVLVVHDDAEVSEWAHARGAMSLRGRTPGLNHAVREGREHLARLGYRRTIVAHADLPRARDLTVADSDSGITIVPDRIGDGTNVMSLPTSIPFTFAYGPGSFERHRRLAEATGLPVRVLLDSDLAWDVDHPDDLEYDMQDAT